MGNKYILNNRYILDIGAIQRSRGSTLYVYYIDGTHVQKGAEPWK